MVTFLSRFESILLMGARSLVVSVISKQTVQEKSQWENKASAQNIQVKEVSPFTARAVRNSMGRGSTKEITARVRQKLETVRLCMWDGMQKH